MRTEQLTELGRIMAERSISPTWLASELMKAEGGPPPIIRIQAINQYARGEKRPNLPRQRRIARILGVPLEQVFPPMHHHRSRRPPAAAALAPALAALAAFLAVQAAPARGSAHTPPQAPHAARPAGLPVTGIIERSIYAALRLLAGHLRSALSEAPA